MDRRDHVVRAVINKRRRATRCECPASAVVADVREASGLRVSEATVRRVALEIGVAVESVGEAPFLAVEPD